LKFSSESSTALESKTETCKIQLIVKIKFNWICSEIEQESILSRTRDNTETLTIRTEEANELRQDLAVLESKIYSERKEIERLESDNRDAVSVSHKNFQEI
jgi:hypothetical protein